LQPNVVDVPLIYHSKINIQLLKYRGFIPSACKDRYLKNRVCGE